MQQHLAELSQALNRWEKKTYEGRAVRGHAPCFLDLTSILPDLTSSSNSQYGYREHQ